MTTHRRAWTTRAGVVVALAATALVAPPAAPALAVDPTIEISGPTTTTLNPGQRVTLTIRITNNEPKSDSVQEGETDSFTISVTSSFSELRCEKGCNETREIVRGKPDSITVTLVAGNVGAGQSRTGQVHIQVQGLPGNASESRTFTVRSATPPMVRSITGKVTDIETGRPIAGAIVAMSDSQNHRYSTTTDANGTYQFVSSASSPISPGEIVIAAEAENYSRSDFKKITAAAGQAVTGPTLALRSLASPSPSASPSASPTPEESAEAATDETPAAVDPDPAASKRSDGGGFGSWLLILLGGLLVAVGVGAIVLLLVRRKDNFDEEDEQESGDSSDRYRRGDDYRGGDDATRIAPPAGQDTDATMVASSLADAPTMVQPVAPVKDDYSDPYRPSTPTSPAPAGQPAGYGATSGYSSSTEETAVFESGLGAGYPPAGGSPAYSATSGGGAYGASAGSGYGNAPAGGSYSPSASAPTSYGSSDPTRTGYTPNEPASGYTAPYSGGYGSPAGEPGGGYGGRDYPPAPGSGYGGPAQGGYGGRYDEPTSRYDSGSDRYGSTSSSYEPSSYGQGDPGRGGYGQQPGYGGSSGYPGGQGGGYPDRGYEASRPGGYGGYEQPYAPPSGYDPANPGYGSSGGYPQGGYGSGAEHGPGGYGDRGYDQGYYDRPADAPRHGAPPPPPSHAERRDWLDS